MAAGGGEKAITQRILRITDIIEEPLTFLTPIGGYGKVPLVSLEQAVEPLVPILPDVQSHAYVAKQRCKNPADALTQDESASIMLYTMGWKPLDECLYIVLNKILRASDRQQKLTPWYLYLRLFLNALSRLPSLSKTAYRGVKSDLSNRYKEGETIVWWGFSSCTTTVGVLRSELFLGATNTRTMFTLQCQSAKDIHNHSYYPAEDEILLMCATQFKVISCLNQGDLHIIQLEETQPPFPLLQPVPIVIPSSILPPRSKSPPPNLPSIIPSPILPPRAKSPPPNPPRAKSPPLNPPRAKSPPPNPPPIISPLSKSRLPNPPPILPPPILPPRAQPPPPNPTSIIPGSSGQSRPTHVPSKNLSANELQRLYDILGNYCVTLATAVAEILHSSHDIWNKQASGVFCFVKDYENRSYCFRSYDLTLGHAIYQDAVPASLRLEKVSDTFYTFNGSNAKTGIKFLDSDEAHTFSHDFHSKQDDRPKKRNLNSATKTSKPSPSATTTTVNTTKKSKSFFKFGWKKNKNVDPNISASVQSTFVNVGHIGTKKSFREDDAQKQVFEDVLAGLHISPEDKLNVQQHLGESIAPASSLVNDTSSKTQDR